MFRKPPILRSLLLNLSTRAGLRAAPHSKPDLRERMPTPYSHPGLLNFSELAETRIRQIIHISEEFWDENYNRSRAQQIRCSEQDDMVLSEDRISTSQDCIFTNRGSRKNLFLRFCSFFLQTKHRENQSFEVQKFGKRCKWLMWLQQVYSLLCGLGFKAWTIPRLSLTLRAVPPTTRPPSLIYGTKVRFACLLYHEFTKLEIKYFEDQERCGSSARKVPVAKWLINVAKS